jgi:hypothetical protein
MLTPAWGLSFPDPVELMEIPQRLAPTLNTSRELYLKSGNECAYPGCDHRIINGDGVFIAEICHIEAALAGGPRFNPKQTNEERRSFENLMLMCHAHHKITDDDAVYTVEKLQQMKTKHEAKFTNVVANIRDSIVDRTTLQGVAPASSLNKMNAVLGWELSPEDAAESAKELAALASRIQKLPRNTRELLTIIVDRGFPDEWHLDDWKALHDDIVEATELGNRNVVKHVEILQRHGIAEGVFSDNQSFIELRGLESGWGIWKDLKTFTDKTGASLREILVDLRFDLLD